MENGTVELLRPDRPRRCTWKPNATNSPHTNRSKQSDRSKGLPDILHAIGQTPLVRLNHIPKKYGIKCEIYAKCEFMNPGGSVKDRIGYRMVVDAEEKGLLTPNCTIIEPTSGNTGIGLAMAAAVKGYKCIIVMPQKMSNEKLYTLQALGAKIIRTPTEAAWDSPESHISVSQKLQREIPNSVILDQYTNSGNPLAHYDTTGTEIWEQCEGKLDYLVLGAGTGGTVSGIGRKIKEVAPHVKVVGVDPEGSTLAEPPELNETATTFYDVEGIGYDFIPTVLDKEVVCTWVKTNDKESFTLARELIRDEGLLVGGSSGAALSAALKFAKDLPEDKRVVVLLPDGIRNYMTKFVSDLWMEARGFIEPPEAEECNKWWWDMTVSQMTFKKPITLHKDATCEEAVSILTENRFHQIPIVDGDGQVEGFVTMSQLLSDLIAGKVKKSDRASNTLVKHYRKVALATHLGRLSRMLHTDAFVVVLDEHNNGKLVGIITQTDLMDFVMHK